MGASESSPIDSPEVDDDKPDPEWEEILRRRKEIERESDLENHKDLWKKVVGSRKITPEDVYDKIFDIHSDHLEIEYLSKKRQSFVKDIIENGSFLFMKRFDKGDPVIIYDPNDSLIVMNPQHEYHREILEFWRENYVCNE